MAMETASFAAIKNCFRCGAEFRSTDNERVCESCRKPKQVARTIATQRLSFREEQIVELIRQAKANKEIAYELHLTIGTVKEYLSRIFRKLDVKSRTELAVWAIRRQLAA
jgi:DNA-binding NarL/FixJ family response regulator